MPSDTVRMRGYLICPVRSASTEDIEEIDRIDAALRAQGVELFNPLYAHKGKNELTETDINYLNRQALIDADLVFVYYKKASSGVHFDLGMAFATGASLSQHFFIVHEEPMDKNDKGYMEVLKNIATKMEI